MKAAAIRRLGNVTKLLQETVSRVRTILSIGSLFSRSKEPTGLEVWGIYHPWEIFEISLVARNHH